MLKDRESQLKIYSLGIVVKDKPRDTRHIDVSPIEELPRLNEKIVDFKPQYNVEFPDVKDSSKKSKVEGKGYISAKWLPLSQGNRYSAPDVVANETVIIYRYADTETYYWDTLFTEPNIRRLETVLYMYGNLRSKLTEWDKDKSYWFEVSTHDKHIKLRTNTSDGEEHAYDVILDTKNSTFTLNDDLGNVFKLSTNDNQWLIENADGSYIDITKDIMNIVTSKSININTETANINATDINLNGNVYLQTGIPIRDTLEARLVRIENRLSALE